MEALLCMLQTRPLLIATMEIASRMTLLRLIMVPDAMRRRLKMTTTSFAARGVATMVVALAAEMVTVRRTKDVVLVGANSFGKRGVGRRYKRHKTSNGVFIGHHHLLNSHRCGT